MLLLATRSDTFASGSVSPPTILVVDDDERIRIPMVRFLSQEGYRVVGVADGKDAEALLREATPDLIITDILMPNTDGLELIRFVRTQAPSVPMIAISGGARLGPENYLHMAKVMGAAKTLQKPFPPEELLTVVQSILARPQVIGDDGAQG